MLRPGIGYIASRALQQTTGDELEKALTSLRKRHDLADARSARKRRRTPVAGGRGARRKLVPQNKRLVYTRGRSSGQRDYYTSEREKLASGPVVG